MPWRRIHLCTGLLERDGSILLVGNRYPNHAELLWNLPGGRQEERETCDRTVVREFAEETGLAVSVTSLAYVAESFDATTCTHFTAFCFHVEGTGEPGLPRADAHVRALRWARRDELPGLLTVGVVGIPLLGYLADPARRYFGFADAGITIAFADEAPQTAGPPAGPTPPGAAHRVPHPRGGPE